MEPRLIIGYALLFALLAALVLATALRWRRARREFHRRWGKQDRRYTPKWLW
jgi:hypothetical protein